MSEQDRPSFVCSRCTQEIHDTFGERVAAALDIKNLRDAVHVVIDEIVDWPGLTPDEHSDWKRIQAHSRLIRERWARKAGS